MLRQILSKNLRTIFSSHPHPHLNIKTGKKLAHPAGGPNAVQGYCEEQVWKNYPGMWSVLDWVVKNISVSSRVTLCNSTDSTITLAHCFQPDGYKDVWPLLIPSMMTFLDDPSRTQARRCSNCFPHAAHYPTKDPSADRCSRAYILRAFPLCPQVRILQLSKSLKTGLSHLSDPETPTLARLTILIVLSKLMSPIS